MIDVCHHGPYMHTADSNQIMAACCPTLDVGLSGVEVWSICHGRWRMLVGDAFDRRVHVQQPKQAQFGDIPSCTQDESGLYGTPEGRKCINSFSHFYHHIKAAFHGRIRSDFRLWQNHYSVYQLTEKICHNMRSGQVVDIKV